MFSPIKNGSSYFVQGLECHLPPVGKVFNKFTNMVEPRKIYKSSDLRDNQVWKVPPKPQGLNKRLYIEHNKRLSNPQYIDSELQEYRDREWDRRVNGFWFYLRGKATYITGLHYFYLSHWTILGEHPLYRDTDKEYFYFWEYCVEDPQCYGMLEVTQRRNGKSVRAGCMMYEYISRSYEKRGGIQSKTDKDAKRLFREQIIAPWKRLELIFRPDYDRSQGSSPKYALPFKETSSKKLDNEFIDTLYLNSSIDFGPSTASTYDGEKLNRYISDECGKVENESIYNRHGVVKPRMINNDQIIGKMLYTTTVEDIGDADIYDEGNFKRLWDESDHMNKNHGTKRTISGLYRYFLPASKGFGFDKYGFPTIEKNIKFIMNEREAASGNSTALLNLKRKFPLTIEEAFYTSEEECIYDSTLIGDQKRALELDSSNSAKFIIGNLSWKDNKIGGEVIFTEDKKKGRLKFDKRYDIVGECKNPRTERDYYGKYIPLMAHQRVIGVDPIDHKIIETTGYSGSRAAAYLYFKYNINDELSETFVCQYLMRPNDLEQFHEDMVLLAYVTGAEVVIENQKQLLINHFRNPKFCTEGFLYKHGVTFGVNANARTHELLASTTDIFIKNRIHNVIYIDLINEWEVFNLKKTTKFDAAMAAGWALVVGYSARLTGITESEEATQSVYDISDFF